MTKKDDALDNIDEQIKKLEHKDDSSSLEPNLDAEFTKEFKGIEVTKVFSEEEISTIITDIENIEQESDGNADIEYIKEQKNPQRNDINKSKVIITIFIILIVVISFIVSLAVSRFSNDDKGMVIDDEKELTVQDRIEAIKHYGEALEGIIGVYYSKQGVLLEYDDAVKLIEFDKDVKCNKHVIYKDGNVYLDKCSVNGIKIDTSYGMVQDESVSEEEILNVYVNKNNNMATLSKPSNISEYHQYSVHSSGVYSSAELLGDFSDYVLYIDSDDKVQIKNYRTGDKVLSNIDYSQVVPIKTVNGFYDITYVAVNINGYWGVYNIISNSQVISPMYSGFSSAANLSVGVNNYFTAVGNDLIIAGDGKNYGVINYITNKIVIPFDYSQLYKSGNYIWAKDIQDVGYVYDVVGKRYLGDEYDEVYGLVNGIYVLVREKENVKLVEIDGKILYDYGKIENIGGVNYSLAYNDGPLFQLFNSSSPDKCIEFSYDPDTKNGITKNIVCGGMAKPVLYLYPEKEMDITVSFEHDEILETTYPKFINEWKVRADPSGNLIDKSGKRYYALYWDEKRFHEVDFKEGFYVEKSDAIEFLEEKLSYIGLNDYERNEFIMYWLPILEKNGKNLIYFELTEERESYNKLNISPKPDSLLRFSIHVRKVDKKISIKKQNLTKFRRKGFVAVEWGGMVY